KFFSPDYNPTEYASIIIQHVQDGIALAREYRLPEKVIAFIPEHHGTSVMQYFYHETLEKSANSNDSPDKKNFQYPGPRPQTKETAVVMLADSLEAASRSIQQPDRENYTQLIDTIIKNKIDDGQLDESNLTLADLSKIKESFLETMMSTFHSRPSYPSKNKTSELENSLESNNQNSVEKANINVSEAGILKGKTDENY
ncbi:MAG: HD domain-containing protein, partial [Spirochaetia bacterium]|nr:HD domain-containing protein [Spirochaetia bacterium]